MSEKVKTSVALMRIGERDLEDQRITPKSRLYIKEVAEGVSQAPFNHALYAPTLIARDTLETLIAGLPNLVCKAGGAIIREEAGIHFEDIEQWKKLIEEARGEFRYLQDIKEAEDRCVKKCAIDPLFLSREGQRLFNFISERVKSLTANDLLLCVMHPPLPETLVLWAMETRGHPMFRAAKPLKDIPVLDPGDNYHLFFSDGLLTDILIHRYRTKILEARGIKAELMRMKR